MSTQIKCPHCGQSFEPSEAFKHEFEEKLVQDLEEKHKKETDEVKAATEEKIRKELELKINAANDEATARDKQNKELQEQLRDLLKQIREIKNEKDNLAVEFEKKLLEDQDRIKQSAKKEAQDELSLRIAEKDKKLMDAEKQIQELQTRLQQGSQQLQGEVQELKLEEILKASFPFDEIKEVPKGINGADAIQVVRTQNGSECGIILWESKRTKAWSPGWIQKLKDDQRSAKAEMAILVTNILPGELETFGALDGVMVTKINYAIGIATILRRHLIALKSAKVSNENKASKAELVYNYLTSNDFKQRIEVWVEYFANRRGEIDKERAYFSKKWEKEEKEIVKVMNNTAGIYGDLQGLIGNALPKVNALELPEN